MTVEVRSCRSVEELLDGLHAIEHYFGAHSELEAAERFSEQLEVERMHIALDGDLVVGGAGAFSFRMSVPGGEVDAAGVTVVGVLPTHRRRGILTALMRDQLADAARRREPVAYLWASEATIYPRYGFGLASRVGQVRIDADRTAFALPFEPRGTVRLVGADEAAVVFPPLYDRLRVERPGMFSRSEAWWRNRRLRDDPARRGGSGILDYALLELDGEPAGYALYRVKQDWHVSGFSAGTVTIVEAVAPGAEATRELWRWLLDFDWTAGFAADLLPLDHPLFLLLAEPRRTEYQLNDGLWVRLVDVGGALAGRAYASDDEIVLEVEDTFLPENAGRWRVALSGVSRTDDAADLRLDVTALGSVYLGGFGFAELVRASRAEELVPGAADRGDALFRVSALPWCPEIF